MVAAGKTVAAARAMAGSTTGAKRLAPYVMVKPPRNAEYVSATGNCGATTAEAKVRSINDN